MPPRLRTLVPTAALLLLLTSSLATAATLAHRWSFDTNADDLIGGADGILVDDAAVSGGQLVLDGAGDRMNFSTTIGIGSNFGATGVTIESWYTDSGSGVWAKLFTFGSAVGGQELAYTHRRSGGQTSAVDRDGTQQFGFDVTTGVEHHLVITVASDGNLNTWLDGAQVLANVNTNNLSNVTSQNEFLGESAWADPEHNGTINEFRIWQGELTPAEVADSFSAGPDSLPGNGPIITGFTATPAARFEGQSSTLSWTVNVTNLTGTLALEVRDPSNAVIHTSSSAVGNTSTVIGDTGGIAQDHTYTLRAWDTDTPGEVRTRTVDIAADPGIPTADDQSLQVVTTTPLGITLSGSDPNNLPNPLSFVLVTAPTGGNLTGTAPNLTYTAHGGFTGTDMFTFKGNDGKYDSPHATITIEVVPEPAPPTDITISTLNISEGIVVGGLIAVLDATDPNPGDTHTFSLVSGPGATDNALFTIVGNQLRAAAGFVGEVGNNFSIRVRATDGGGLLYEEILVLTVVEASDGVVINEIHFNPPDNTIRQEFIELHNPSVAAVNLTGWRISGAVNFSIPVNTMIPADGYLVIAEDPATLAATLGTGAIGPYTGSLDSEGETVRLRDQNDTVIDFADYRVGFPWPVLGDGDGASIELIHPSLDNSLGSSWRGSVPSAGLPEITYLNLNSTGWSWRPGSSEASNPTTAWRQQGFVEDGTWTGNVQLPIGYGTVNGITLNTTISGMQNNYTCIFLRKEFTIAPGEVPSQLEIFSTSDDGFVMWINGVEVERRRFSGEPLTGLFATNQGNEGAFETRNVLGTAGYLVEGTNTIAVQLINTTLGSSDCGFDVRVRRPGSGSGLATPTPGGRNAAYALNAAPNIRKVKHTQQPTSTDPIVITALITDPEGVGPVTLEYQVVAPGAYVPAVLPLPISGGNINLSVERPDNPAYESNWTTVTMIDDGSGDDALAGDDIYTVTLPAQAHRRLVRYRITVEDDLGLSARVPYPDDPSLNFACFVYNGVPSYQGNTSTTLQTLPVYHLITRGEDYAECFAYNSSDQISQGTEARFFYNWNGTLVYDGIVYDNLRYRLRGANGRYHNTGKRSMRFRLNRGDYFQARDQFGKKYDKKWRTLTTGKCFDNRSTQTFALNEAVSMYLFNKIGVPGSDTHWVHWRVIDAPSEAPDQWRGDFNGLNFVIETYDIRFMEAHGLEKGNLYKLINQTGDWKRQQRYQAAFAPNNGADHNNIEGNLDGGDTESYITAHVNIDKWNHWHALVEAIRHYDYWPSANKNMVYYFEPDYLPANGNRGKLWILPWDTDASWGPTWNSGHDVVYNSLFAASGGGSDGNTTPSLWPGYFNVVREVRDLLWQPDQINPLVDEFASFISQFEAADAARWKGAPSDAGNYGGLGGAGAISLANLVQDMKNFAFSGGSWPGGGVGAGGRAAHLDSLQASQGEGGQIPNKPTITYTGSPGFPTSGIAFQCSSFSDPQGSGTFGAMEWRVAEITDAGAPNYDPTERFKLEWEADWESGELTAFNNSISIPTVAVRSGRTYRARVRHKDSSGRWSHWSNPRQFTTTLPDISDYLNGLVISEFMYHPPGPSAAEIAAGFTDEEFFEFIELQNVGPVALDLTDLRFTKGADFDFLGADITTLAPGEFVLVVANRTAFELRYGPGLPIAGEWQSTDKLDNGGEQLKLSFGAGDGIRDFIYDDLLPWPTTADGGGPSLTLIDPASVPLHNLASSWRASFAPGGTPGLGESSSPFAAWLANLGVSDPLSDFGESNLSHLLVHLLGGDLTPLPGDALPIGTTVLDGGQTYPAIQFRVRQGTDVTWTVEVSTDLLNWDDGPAFSVQVGAPTDNGDGTETYTVRSLQPIIGGNVRQFLRLRIEAP